MSWSWFVVHRYCSVSGFLFGARTEPPGFDQWGSQVIAAHPYDWMVSGALDPLGGGWIAIQLGPLVVILALLLARRWGGILAASVFLVSAGVVQLLKNLFARAHPEDMIIARDFGSFPSGHTANAATLGGALIGAGIALLLAAWTLPWARTTRSRPPPQRHLLGQVSRPPDDDAQHE